MEAFRKTIPWIAAHCIVRAKGAEDIICERMRRVNETIPYGERSSHRRTTRYYIASIDRVIMLSKDRWKFQSPVSSSPKGAGTAWQPGRAHWHSLAVCIEYVR